MTSDFTQQAGEARVHQLVERFTHIGESAMRDLPIYNHSLEVDAVGFKIIDEGLIGVLITPWFINVMLLPRQKQKAAVPLGEKVTYSLVSGEHEFIVGEDDELGRYDFITVASPTLRYKSHQAARDAAYKALEKLLTHPEKTEVKTVEQPMHFVSPEQKGKERRAFLRGLINGGGSANPGG
jgi:[NiFe] hydrogenase assembly HybE family chaperone